LGTVAAWTCSIHELETHYSGLKVELLTPEFKTRRLGVDSSYELASLKLAILGKSRV